MKCAYAIDASCRGPSMKLVSSSVRIDASSPPQSLHLLLAKSQLQPTPPPPPPITVR